MSASHHLVFTGNPGTGKTTVARLVARLYRTIGVLSKGQLVEATRADLIAGYVGQTALKVQEVVRKAIGGILFIDEAYALAPEGPWDFGNEAIATLVQMMEENRRDLAVIAAGYPGGDEALHRFEPGPAQPLHELHRLPRLQHGRSSSRSSRRWRTRRRSDWGRA